MDAIKLSEDSLKLFASPWSAPGKVQIAFYCTTTTSNKKSKRVYLLGWMKTNGQMMGAAKLKGKFLGKYYKTYAEYFLKFFERYADKGIKFWGVTIQVNLINFDLIQYASILYFSFRVINFH